MVIFGGKKIHNRSILLFLIVSFFLVGFGYILGLQFGEPFKPHNHSLDHNVEKHHEGLTHIEPLEIMNDIEFAFELIQENRENWNVLISAQGFKFTPENVGEKHISGEGHAHVYIDGVKHGRIYGNWYHLGLVNFGSHIKVTLNSNDHKPLFKNGIPLEITHIVKNKEEN